MIVIGINAAPAGRGALRARLAQTHFERESMVNDGEGEINSGQSNFSHESPVVNLVIKVKEKDQSRHCLRTCPSNLACPSGSTTHRPVGNGRPSGVSNPPPSKPPFRVPGKAAFRRN